MATTTFTDRKGRQWDVALDLRNARLVDATDLSIFGVNDFSILRPDKQSWHRLLTDAPFLFAVIWAMVQDQAIAKHAAATRSELGPGSSFPVSPREDYDAAELEFVSGINGPVIDKAREAMVEALSDFFPEHRTVLSTLHRQIMKLRTKVDKIMESTEPMLEAMMDQQLQEGVEKMRQELAKKSGPTSILSPPTPISHTETSLGPASP